MSGTREAQTIPCAGDQVILLGTRIVGEVTRVDVQGRQRRVSVKVSAVLGKAHGSKAARAWRGACLTCPPALLTSLSPSLN
jgi:hypothetical protein